MTIQIRRHRTALAVALLTLLPIVALLFKIQQLMHERVMFIPIWELAFINGYGPRVQESGLGLIPGHAYSAPYEDVKLKGK